MLVDFAQLDALDVLIFLLQEELFALALLVGLTPVVHVGF